MNMFQVRMKKTAADVAGVRHEGRVYEVDELEAEELAKAGAAEILTVQKEAPVAERADAPPAPPENGGRGRRRANDKEAAE